MLNLNNCKPESAWHTWQIAGANWAAKNPQASIADIKAMAAAFAEMDSGGQPHIEARKRAFIEGARHG